MNKHDYRPFREGSGIILRNTQKQIFIGHRLNSRIEQWQMPQGGIDPGETPSEAFERELFEEVGISRSLIDCVIESQEWFYYELPYDVSLRVWDGKYKGQKQKWFVCDFIGNDADININTPIPEFSQWKWSSTFEIMQIIVDFKRPMYHDIFNHFTQRGVIFS